MEQSNLLKISHEQFRKYYISKKYTQDAFRDEFIKISNHKITSSLVSLWLSGKRSIPLKYIDTLSLMFGVSREKLLDNVNTDLASLDYLINQPKIINERVALLMTTAGYTQDDFAKMLSLKTGKSISASYISLWMTARRNISLKYLSPISEIFGVGEPYLLGLTDDPSATYEEIDKEIRKNSLVQIEPWQLYAYDKQPLYIVFKNYEHPDEWALYNRPKREFIFTSDSISEQALKKMDFSLYTKDISRSNDVTLNRRSLDYKTFLKYDEVWIEILSSNEFLQGKYNGWYHHNEDRTCIINSEGLILPYSGFKKAYLAYACNTNN